MSPILPVSRSALLVLVAVLAMAASSISAAAFTIKEVTSPGGIKAWLVEDHAIPLIAMDFSFSSGAIHDPDQRQGVSAFLAGMLDEGAGALDSQAFQRKRDALAFRMSFDSGADHFEGSFQTLSRNREESFEMLRLAVTAPRFDAEPLQRVRQQILLGLAQKQDDPQTIGMQAWLRLALPGDPYARDNEGTTETIAATTADDLRAAHQRIFRREFLQVAVVGDIDAATLGAMLDKVFGTLPSGARDAALPPVAPATGPKRQIVDREMPQSIILFGHEGLPIADPDFIAAYVMSEILGGGDFGTRLTEEIREKRGLTYGISFTLWPQDRTDLYFGMLQTSNAKAAEALALVKDVLARMAAEGPTQQELDEVKSYLTGSYALRFSSNAAIAGQLLGMQQAGRPIDYVLKRNSLIEAVTLDQVKAQARRLLHPDRLLVTIVGKPANLD